MKSASQWAEEFIDKGLCLAPLRGNEPVAVIEIVKQIQLDAWKQGMSNAMGIVNQNSNSYVIPIVEDIKEARDNYVVRYFLYY